MDTSAILLGTEEPKVPDYFLSYSNVDRRWAEWIAWQLQEAGRVPVLQAWDFQPGSNFVLAMDKAVSTARRTLLLLSPDYLDSVFAKPEWAAVFADDPTGENGKLVPIVIRKCALKGLLTAITQINLLGLPEDEAREVLLTSLERGVRRPASAPEFPGPGKRLIAKAPRFPGEWPVLWNIPHLRNRHFVGREELLAQVREALEDGEEDRPRVQVLHGLGGIGKTQTALEYAYRYAEKHYLVWWLRAEEPVSLVTDYAALWDALELPEVFLEERSPKGEALNQRLRAVRRWLERNQDWLLIFDDADNPKDLQQYLPGNYKGHVVVTSRNPNWLAVATPRQVSPLDRSSATGFLLRRTMQQEEEAASVLAGELGDLPLALEQAGAYVEETGISLAAYLELFRVRRLELLGRGSSSTSYPATVATTWLISFQHVERTLPMAGDLLRLASFFAPDNIPLALFVEGAAHLPAELAAAVTDPVLLLEARASLRRYSLVSLSDDALSIHRLVQAVVIDRMTREERAGWARIAVEISLYVFSRRVGQPDLLFPLLPHALAAAAHAESWGLARDLTGDLFSRVGLFLSGAGYFREARICFVRALVIEEGLFGPHHTKVATVLNNLGSAERGLGLVEEARSHHERALAIDQAAHPGDHPDVAIDLYNLGLVYFDLEHRESAYELLAQAIGMLTRTLGEEDPDTVLVRKNVEDLRSDED